MRKASIMVAVLCFAACDGPGGGGGGGGTQDTSDTAGSDTVFVGPDVTDGGGDSGGGTCTNGERRCVGQSAQQCVNGNFTDLFTCPSNQICEAGACKAGGTTDTSDTSDTTDVVDTTPPDPCAGRECGPDGRGGSCGVCEGADACNPSGQCVGCSPQCNGKECGSDGCGGSCGQCNPASEQCVQGSCEPNEVCDCGGAECGVDNCGNSCGTCAPTASCQAGNCVSNSDGGTCTDLIDCIYGDVDGCYLLPDEGSFNACVDTCYAATSQTGIDEFESYLGCVQACPVPDDDPNTTDDDLAYDRCSYQNCSAVEAWCVLDDSGGGTCFGIFDCMDLCAEGDSDCYKGCYEQATPEAQAALWGINGCLLVECPDDADQTCVDDAIAGACAQFVVDCQNN